MDALAIRCAILAAAVASMGASYRSPNFIVEAPTPQMAEQIGTATEKFRNDLAIDWLGKPMPNWAQPCPIEASVGPQLGAGGATSFVFEHGEVFGWRMTIQGSLERILDSVLPHEVTHTIFATHFRQPLPRWADEGACTTVEHSSERDKQTRMLIDFLHTNRGIAFSRMFAMREYPRDVMPLYSQGYSLARFLIAQGGKKKFLNYVADGMKDENWSRATKQHYNFDDLLSLQNGWLAWVKQGSPAIGIPDESPALIAVNTPGPSDRNTRDQPLARTEAFPPANSALPPATGGRSIYEVSPGGAPATPAANTLASSSDVNWQARGSSTSQAETASEMAAQLSAADRVEAPVNMLPGPSYSVTRPQEIQRPRQVIREWNRPSQNDPTRTAGRTLPGPL
jgi:hypothetical protein